MLQGVGVGDKLMTIHITGTIRASSHLVLVAIVGLVESFSEPVQLSETWNHPHTLEDRGQITTH